VCLFGGEWANAVKGRRCQEWTRELVGRLMERGFLAESAVQVLDEAKKLETTSL
jgi:hypothetical protein